MMGDSETAFEVGIELSAAIREAPEEGRDAVVCEHIDRLLAARAETEADAYTLTIWAASLLRELARILPDPLPGEPAGVQYAINLVAALCFRASAALEHTTGLQPELFSGEPSARN